MTLLTGLYKIRKDYSSQSISPWILSNSCIISMTWKCAWIHHACFSYLVSYSCNESPISLPYKRHALFHCEGWVILYNEKRQPPLAEMKAAF